MVHHPPFGEVQASRPDYERDLEVITTKTADTSFAAGDGLNDLPSAKEFREGKFKSIVPEDKTPAEIYKMLISGVVRRLQVLPRRANRLTAYTDPKTDRVRVVYRTQWESERGWLSLIRRCVHTEARGGSQLAPFSWFNTVSQDPPTIMISVSSAARQDGGSMKDTSANIKATNEFSVSIISEPFVEASNFTSIDAPPDIDEWKLAGLTPRASETIKAPHVAESAFSMECTLAHWHEIKNDAGKVTSTVILGRIRRIQVVGLYEPISRQGTVWLNAARQKEFVLDPEDPMKVLLEKLRPVSRLGGIAYGRTTQMLEIPRPVWDKVKDTPEVKKALEK
ncbi:hypothetical protein P7C73_g1655, partial [Tremellales sp. Uapishka_1]